MENRLGRGSGQDGNGETSEEAAVVKQIAVERVYCKERATGRPVWAVRNKSGVGETRSLVLDMLRYCLEMPTGQLGDEPGAHGVCTGSHQHGSGCDQQGSVWVEKRRGLRT